MNQSSNTQADKELTHALTRKELFEYLRIGDTFPGWGEITQKNWRANLSGSHSVEIYVNLPGTNNEVNDSWDTDLKTLVLAIVKEEPLHVLHPLNPAERYELTGKTWTNVNVTCAFKKIS